MALLIEGHLVDTEQGRDRYHLNIPDNIPSYSELPYLMNMINGAALSIMSGINVGTFMVMKIIGSYMNVRRAAKRSLETFYFIL
ncbi:19528_t:CDS:2 [Funneliformis geosporum]|nr:19528_t:CDS:2 [Funneliformis geosporum]